MIAATLLLFSGLWLFGIYFSFGLSDLVLAAFLACAYYFGIAHAEERSFAVAVALFGAATAMFEFLTGGIPFGLALLLGVIALDGPPDRDALLRRAFHGIMIFALAVVLTFAIKLALVMLFIDPHVLGDFRSALSTRLGASFVDSLPAQETAWLAARGVDVSALDRHWTLALLYMIARLAYATFVIGFGSPVLGMVIMGAAIVAGVGLMIRRARAARDAVTRTRLLVLLGSALVVPAWSVLFLNHTLLHAIWMVRPFAWFIALAGLLLWWPAEDRTAARLPRVACPAIPWLGRQDSNLGMAESKSAALPLGYAPSGARDHTMLANGAGVLLRNHIVRESYDPAPSETRWSPPVYAARFRHPLRGWLAHLTQTRSPSR